MSQESISNKELWLKIGVSSPEKELGGFSIGLEQGLRYDMDYKERKNSFTELTAEVKIIKGLNMGGSFRFIDRTSKKRPESLRLSAILKYKVKIGDYLRPEYRFKYERQTTGDFPVSQRLRNRLGLRIGKGSWLAYPYLSMEYFYLKQDVFDAWSKRRMKMSLKSSFHKNHGIELAYLLQQNINEDEIEKDKIISLEYGFSF